MKECLILYKNKLLDIKFFVIIAPKCTNAPMTLFIRQVVFAVKNKSTNEMASRFIAISAHQEGRFAPENMAISVWKRCGRSIQKY